MKSILPVAALDVLNPPAAERCGCAGWIVALCGVMMTMPGLGKKPAAHAIDIDADGNTIGLF